MKEFNCFIKSRRFWAVIRGESIINRTVYPSGLSQKIRYDEKLVWLVTARDCVSPEVAGSFPAETLRIMNSEFAFEHIELWAKLLDYFLRSITK